VKLTARKFLTLEDAHVKLGVMCTIGPMRFTGFLGEFQHKFPGIELNVIEDTAAGLARRLEDGAIDVAVIAQAEAFSERHEVRPLYRERFTIAFPVGHRLAGLSAVPIKAIDGEQYLRRINCEFRDHLGELCRKAGAAVEIAYASEREDWILNMVAAGLGICFLPEYSAIVPGVLTRPVVEPEVFRDVSLVTMTGRRFSPATQAFIKSIRAYAWPGSRNSGSPASAAA
jgi:DNA-binding transcriptional LysR family regulator